MKTAAIMLVLGATFLAGCATLDKDECLAVDWRTIGYEDGVAGRAGGRVGEHRKACAKHGVAVDLDAYQAGRAEGLREYCQPANGFRAGASGAPNHGACPADLAPAFADAWQSGRELYLLERRVDYAHSELAARRAELEDIEDTLARLAGVVISDQSSRDERAQALLDTKQLAERHGRIEAEIGQLEYDRLRYEQELEDYRRTVSYGG